MRPSLSVEKINLFAMWLAEFSDLALCSFRQSMAAGMWAETDAIDRSENAEASGFYYQSGLLAMLRYRQWTDELDGRH